MAEFLAPNEGMLLTHFIGRPASRPALTRAARRGLLS